MKYSPEYQRKICQNAQICFLSDFPTLNDVRIAYGENTASVWLIPQLTNLSEFCGCKEKMNGKQIEECAIVIATEFSYLKISEIMLFFFRFKSGKYGRFYGAVDPLVITESLRKFLNERSEYIASFEHENRMAHCERNRFIPPKGHTSLSWYNELKSRAKSGDEEAIELITPKTKSSHF